MDLFRIYKGVQTKYEYLQNKYDSKQWVNGLMTPQVQGMLYGYSSGNKHKY